MNLYTLERIVCEREFLLDCDTRVKGMSFEGHGLPTGRRIGKIDQGVDCASKYTTDDSLLAKCRTITRPDNGMMIRAH